MIDETGNVTANNETAKEERIGFCQDCGRPLTRETVRTVGSGVFCEPCLEERVGPAAAVPPVPPVGAAGVPPPPPEGFPAMGGADPSPTLAFLLGLIPGVGAMYNGQFAKGIAHIVIFALLESMANVNGVFGILVAGWVFYQAFEAYYTAKARREGSPLPDPFGLNNIGAQVGVHFRATANRPQNPGQPTGYPNWTGYVPPPPVPPVQPVPPVGAWGSASAVPPVSPYTAPVPPPVPVWDTPAWTPPSTGTPVQDAAYSYSVPPVRVIGKSTIPGAAAWLIGLGVIFLLLNVVPDLRFSVHKIFPFLLMAFAVWLFVRRMWMSGGVGPVEGEGEGYAARAACFLRAPGILFTVGVLWMLQEFDVFRFHQSWPVLIIVIGVLLLIERSLGGRVLPVAAPVVVDGNVDGKVI